jgi:hypothetical protein
MDPKSLPKTVPTVNEVLSTMQGQTLYGLYGLYARHAWAEWYREPEWKELPERDHKFWQSVATDFLKAIK